MELKPHEERVIKERDELQEKEEKLFSFIGSDTYNGLPDRDKELLIKQHEVMSHYLIILNERIGRFVKV